MNIQLTINGEERVLDVQPGELLLHTLRKAGVYQPLVGLGPTADDEDIIALDLFKKVFRRPFQEFVHVVFLGQ